MRPVPKFRQDDGSMSLPAVAALFEAITEVRDEGDRVVIECPGDLGGWVAVCIDGMAHCAAGEEQGITAIGGTTTHTPTGQSGGGRG